MADRVPLSGCEHTGFTGLPPLGKQLRQTRQKMAVSVQGPRVQATSAPMKKHSRAP